MTVPPISFEECNQRLRNNNIILSLHDYVNITHTIPYIGNQDDNPVEVAELINFILSTVDHHPNDFAISLDTIEKFGFITKNTMFNRFRLWANMPINRIDNELAFMRKHKLQVNIDYILYRQRISSFECELDLGYKITNLAFFKLMNIKYDKVFLTLLDARIFQIVSNYQKYLNSFYDDRIKSLQQTIHGLTEDISKLITTQSNLSRSMINDVTGESYEHPCNCMRDSYVSDDGSCSGSYSSHIDTPTIDVGEDNWLYADRLTLLTPPSRGSPIDTILELNQSNILDNMHKKLLNLINSPTGSNISSVCNHNTIDGIQSTHIDSLRRRFSTFVQTEPKKDPFRCSVA